MILMKMISVNNESQIFKDCIFLKIAY